MADSIEQTGQEISGAPVVPAGIVPSPGVFAAIRNFFREVIVELRKTYWPSANELTKFTVVVMVTVVTVAIVLGLMDWLAGFLLEHVIRMSS